MTLSEAFRRVREAERNREFLHALRGPDPEEDFGDEWRGSRWADDAVRESSDTERRAA